jgi:uncharacterized protein (DUF2062 family)
LAAILAVKPGSRGLGLMLFRRRTKPNLAERLRATLWPRGGWPRAMRYFGKRMLRLSGSPHAIAIGCAAGLFVAWSPLFGLHYGLAIACALIVRGNVLAALLATTIGNPLTLPAMWVADFKLGERLLGAHHVRRLAFELQDSLAHRSFNAILPIVKPIFIGSIPLGLISACIGYFIVRGAVQAYQRARRERLEARRVNRVAEARTT